MCVFKGNESWTITNVNVSAGVKVEECRQADIVRNNAGNSRTASGGKTRTRSDFIILTLEHSNKNDRGNKVMQRIEIKRSRKVDRRNRNRNEQKRKIICFFFKVCYWEFFGTQVRRGKYAQWENVGRRLRRRLKVWKSCIDDEKNGEEGGGAKSKK